MKALITNYRYWVLTALAFIIIIGLVAIPQTALTLSSITQCFSEQNSLRL